MSRLNLVYCTQSEPYALLPEQLAPEEKYAFKRKKSLKSKNQYLASRGVIKCHLSRHFKVDQDSIALCFDQELQLIVAYQRTVPLAWLSLSHSGSFVCMLYSETPTSQIGVDIEDANKQRDFMSLAEISLSEQEHKQVIESSNTCLSFYSHWTIKESISKASNLALTSVFQKSSESILKEYNLSAVGFLQDTLIGTAVYPQNKQLDIWDCA